MLRARVITALLLLAALLGVLFLLPRLAAAAVLGLVAALAAWEWAGLMRVDNAARGFFAGLVLLFCWQTHIAGATLLVCGAAAVFWIAAALPWLRFRWPVIGNDFAAYGLGLLLTVSSWAAMVALHERSPWLLLGVLALAWVADIAAYFAGRAFGRRKLAPQVSPGKTWEGVAGGVAGVLLYGVVVAVASGQLAGASPAVLLGWAALLMLLTALGVVGDLFESLVKRQAGVKDSGNLLPGHGGILDRIDSQIAILPVAALVLHWSGK